MEFSVVVGFTIVALLIAISPGPDSVLIIRTVPLSGRSAGVANIAGFLAAIYLYGFLSILGLTFLVTKSAVAFELIKVIGAAYLCGVGVRSLWLVWQKKITTGNEPGALTSKRTLTKAFFEGLVTTVTNPSTFVFYIAILPQFIPRTGAGYSAVLLVCVYAVISVAWFLILILVSSRLAKAASGYAFQQLLTATTGFVFIVFGLKMAKMTI